MFRRMNSRKDRNSMYPRDLTRLDEIAVRDKIFSLSGAGASSHDVSYMK